MNEPSVLNITELLQKADLLAKQRLWDEDANLLIPVKDSTPKNINLLSQLGWYLSRAKRYSEAIDIFNILIELEPKKAKWPYMIGYQYYDQKNWKEAIIWFDKSIDLYPDYIVVIYRKGYACTQINQIEEAIRCFEKVMLIWQKLENEKKEMEQSNYSDAAFQLGKVFLKKGLSRKAEYPFSESVKYDSEDAYKYYNYGKALLKNNKPAEALEQLKKANKLEPKKDYIQDCLAQAYAGIGEVNTALEMLIRIPEKYRKHYIWRTIGAILYKDCQFEQAIKPSQNAVKAQPDNHNYLFQLGQIYFKVNQAQKAYPILEKAIKFKYQNYEKPFPEAESLLNEIIDKEPNIQTIIETQDASDGMIKTYNRDRGFGFIKSYAHEEDIFFHISEVNNSELINNGLDATFSVESSPKGLKAINITLLI